jgi:hypothetical protein
MHRRQQQQQQQRHKNKNYDNDDDEGHYRYQFRAIASPSYWSLGALPSTIFKSIAGRCSRAISPMQLDQ